MKLHIGGKEPKDGWKILNVQHVEGVDFIGDITNLSQFADESIDEIYASHVLEHVQQSQVFDTLKGIHRILVPKGKFYCSVPDLDILCHAFISPGISRDAKIHVMRMIFGGQVDRYDFHYFGWCQRFLFEFLRTVGFSSYERVSSFGIFSDTSDFKPYGIAISLNVIAIK